LSNTALLCFISFCSCFSMGAFSPLLPEIGRAGALADWQLGVVAGALGFARMATAVPAGLHSEPAQQQHHSVTIWVTIRGQRGKGVR
jgi:MFS family permease